MEDILDDLKLDDLSVREKYGRFRTDPQAEMRERVSLEERMGIVATSLATALDEFSSLGSITNLHNADTFIRISGIDYSLPHEVTQMNYAVEFMPDF